MNRERIYHAKSVCEPRSHWTRLLSAEQDASKVYPNKTANGKWILHICTPFNYARRVFSYFRHLQHPCLLRFKWLRVTNNQLNGECLLIISINGHRVPGRAQQLLWSVRFMGGNCGRYSAENMAVKFNPCASILVGLGMRQERVIWIDLSDWSFTLGGTNIIG